MTPDEIVKALHKYAKNAQENFEVDTMRDFDSAADLIESLQADLRHEEKVSHGQMEQNKRLRKMMDKLQARLAESQRREQAAVEVLDEIYERTRPGGKKGGYPYGGTTCIGDDIYNIAAKWRGQQETGNENI